LRPKIWQNFIVDRFSSKHRRNYSI
jgi:hypothetical protein